jgi:hypothetical protein
MSIKSDALSPPATLAGVLDRLTANVTLPRQRRRDLMSGVRQVARMLGDVPADIPADPEALRRRLRLLTPAAAGRTPSRLRNIRALLTAALDLTGAKIMRGRRVQTLGPVWLRLLRSVGDPYERHKLSRFFSFISAKGIDPDHVDDRTVSQFADSLERSSLLERRIRIVRDSCRIWNKCAQTIARWPNIQLTVPDRRRVYALPATAYPRSFGDDVAAYLEGLRRGDLFAGHGPARPTTLRDLRLRLFQMAAALVHSGRAPDTIRTLADLVTPEALKTVLKFIWSRNGNRKTGQMHNIALTAIKIAKWRVKASQEQMEALRDIRHQVDPKNSGMTERNRSRLRQFDDPENVRRLIRLPEEVFRSLPQTAEPYRGDPGPVGASCWDSPGCAYAREESCGPPRPSFHANAAGRRTPHCHSRGRSEEQDRPCLRGAKESGRAVGRLPGSLPTGHRGKRGRIPVPGAQGWSEGA